MVDAHSTARREMAKEKARIYRKRDKKVSFLEQEAVEWKSQREKELIRKEEQKGVQTEDVAVLETLRKAPAPSKPQEKKGVNPTGWVQYSPWGKDEKEKKQRQISVATIWCFAKKLIAKEWARARGVERRDPRLYLLEQKAARWKEKKDEEERRKEEQNRRTQRQKELLDRSLAVLGERLLEAGKEISPELAAKLFQDTLGDVGEVIDVDWTRDGGDIWIEPWEEKRLRQRRGNALPFTHKLKIGNKLQILSYEPVDGDEARVEKQKAMILRTGQTCLAAKPAKTEDECKKILEDALGRIGRVIDIKHVNEEWSAQVEPWEEMRLRNLQRQGRSPLVTYEVKAKVSDEKLEIISSERRDGHNF